MQELLIITLLFLVGYMFLIKIIFSMMQDDGMWDVLFNFSKFRDKLYTQGEKNPKLRLLENALGGCEQCTAFWWMLPCISCYYVFLNVRFVWITFGLTNWFSIITVNIIWITLFWALGAGLGHWFLTYKNKSQ